MTGKPLFIVWVIALLLAASWIAPPWIQRSHEDHPWGLLFDPEMVDQKIDFTRLAMLDAAILLLGGVALFTVRRSN